MDLFEKFEKTKNYNRLIAAFMFGVAICLCGMSDWATNYEHIFYHIGALMMLPFVLYLIAGFIHDLIYLFFALLFKLF